MKAVEIKKDGTLIVRTRYFEDVKKVIVGIGNKEKVFIEDDKKIMVVEEKD